MCMPSIHVAVPGLNAVSPVMCADAFVTQQYLDKLNVIDALQLSLRTKYDETQDLFQQGVSEQSWVNAIAKFVLLCLDDKSALCTC